MKSRPLGEIAKFQGWGREYQIESRAPCNARKEGRAQNSTILAACQTNPKEFPTTKPRYKAIAAFIPARTPVTD